MSVAYEDLTADDRTAILAEADRVKAIPPGVNTTSPGCFMLVVAVVLLIAWPSISRHVGPGMFLRILVWVFVAAEVFVGGLGVSWYFRGSGGAYAKAAISAEQAITTIATASAEGNGRECGLAAARLVAGAYCSDGPTTSTTFSFDAARSQLGPALPFVIAVEKFILAEQKADPVFTLEAAIVESSSQANV